MLCVQSIYSYLNNSLISKDDNLEIMGGVRKLLKRATANKIPLKN